MTKVETYVEAQRAVNAFKCALADEPELKQDSAWRARFTQASAQASIAYGKLTGSECGRAERQLREGSNGPDRA